MAGSMRSVLVNWVKGVVRFIILALFCSASNMAIASDVVRASQQRCGGTGSAAGDRREHDSRASDRRTEINKRIVERLFAIIYGTSIKDIDCIDDIVAVDYVQHNPRAAQGRAGLKEFLRVIVPPPKELDPKDTLSVTYIAEGNLVVRQEMRRNGMLIDIFRVENGLLKEHWDAFRFAPGAPTIPGF